MKRFTLFAIAALLTVVAFAQKQRMMPQWQVIQRTTVPFTGVQKVAKTASHVNRVAKVEGVDELVTLPEGVTPETYYTASGSFLLYSDAWEDATSDMPSIQVAVVGSDIYVQGLAYWVRDAWIKGTIDGTTATFPKAQQIDFDEQYPEWISGSDDGETLTDIVFDFDQEAGVLKSVTQFIGECAATDAFSIYSYWIKPTFTKEEPVAPEVVELPEGLTVTPCVMTYTNYNGNEASAPVNVAIDPSTYSVYLQGVTSYLPESWIKGTAVVNDATSGSITVTFPGGQYFGNYGSNDIFLQDDDVVFTGVLNLVEVMAGNYQSIEFSAEGPVYAYTGNLFTDYYVNPVIKAIVEKAAMPANPEITSLKNGNYGWYFNYNVPVVDVDGNGLVSDKLSYMIYTDTEGEIAPLTFTPATHSRLTEDMTEIPYGFTENYDFYTNQIYLNELYSADWNNIGIQSIYRGGGEENATEIQWFHIKDYAAATTDVTFDFNAMDLPMSHAASGDVQASTEGDITETAVFTEGGVTLAISPKEETASTENRFWAFTVGENTVPQLRMYSGTMTFTAPEGATITSIVFNYQGKYWGGSNNSGKVTPDNGTIQDTKNGVATWTGEAQEVVVTVGANTQINSIVVTIATAGDEPQPIEPAVGELFSFDDGKLGYWTTIDADGDGYTWTIGQSPSINTHGDDQYCVYSESYSSTAGALTPDNYLVSPKMKLDGKISFYACAQDREWPAEHFGVAVSTAGNTDAADFQMVQDWTMTAAREYQPTNARGTFRGPKKAPGNWYLYTVDLSQFAGAEGYVAIRHFDCTDYFYLVVDDITLETSQIILPDYVISPEPGTVKSLNDFEITFNNYTVALAEAEAAQAELYKDDNFDEPFATATISLVNDHQIAFSFDDIKEAGEYTLLIPDGTLAIATGGVLGDLEFGIYTIDAKPEVVELPEGLEPETWYFSATASESSVRNQEVAVAIDGNDIYVQGINTEYLPEAWVKGTIDAEAGTATFPTGQYFGAFEYDGEEYDMFFVGYDNDLDEVSDVVFTFDAENGVLTTDTWVVVSALQDKVSYYEYYQGMDITREPAETPDLVELPEGVEAEVWTIDGTFADNFSSDNIVRQTEVAFDGNDIYVKGIAFYFEEAWMKGTIDAATGIATFPTGQFVGEDEYGLEFVVGSDDGKTLCDIEFAYDADAKTLTQQTSYIIDNANTPDEIAPYGNWTNMFIYEGEAIIEEPIEAPEDLVTETYLFKATELPLSDDPERARVLKTESEATTFNFNTMDVATSDNNGGTDGDITQELTLTNDEDGVTLIISPKEESATTPNRFWGTSNGPQLRVYSGTLTFEVPEGSSMTKIEFNAAKWNEGNSANTGAFEGATWTGDAQSVVVTIAGNTQINSIAVTVSDGDEPGGEPDDELNYTYQMEVGFDGNDVYFKGVSDDTADLWLKGTLSEDGKTVTIPANQYMGEVTALWFTFPYYFTAVAEDGVTMEDIVLNYDAETSTFTTDQTLVLHDGKRSLGEPYQVFTNVEITKMPEFAATPADPSIDSYKLEGTSYPYIEFEIPVKDVDDNDILASKLFYTVWIQKGNEVAPFVVTADAYRDVEVDMTEVPYNYDDSYDIYKGGSKFYINTTDDIATWEKIGIQSIYYGGGERNESNIVWMENPVYDPTTTGISTVKADNLQNAVIYNLAGQRLQTVQKGLNIINGRKVMVK